MTYSAAIDQAFERATEYGEVSEHQDNPYFLHGEAGRERWDDTAITADIQKRDAMRIQANRFEDALKDFCPEAAVEFREFFSDLEGTTLWEKLRDLVNAGAA